MTDLTGFTITDAGIIENGTHRKVCVNTLHAHRTATVDGYGKIKAQIAALEKQAAAMRADIIAMGESPIEGDLFRVTVSTTERETLDMDAVRAKLSPQFIRAHTRVTAVTVVKAVARNGRP